MNNMDKKETRVRTTGELSVLLKAVGGLLGAMSFISVFFAGSVLAIVLILLVPVLYAVCALLIVRKYKQAMMVNVIDAAGIKNEYFGEPRCFMEWDEIGDFGVAEARKGLFRGRYIYVSRIFISQEMRRDIIRRYDPRVCIVLPCTDEICNVVREESRGKIDIR